MFCEHKNKKGPMPSKKKCDAKPCRRWDPQGLPTNFAMLCSSARRAGKTTLLKSLCIQEPGAWLSRFEDGFITVFAGNEHCASEYRSFIPGKYVHSSLRLDVIQSYWEWCDRQRANQKPLPPCLMIFDDVLVTQSSKKYGVTRTSNNYWLNRIWAEGRHQNISSVLSVQSLSVGLPFIRCSDVFVCFPSAIYAGQDWKMLTENYMPCQDKRTAAQVADCFTQHEAMVCEYFRQTSRRWETRLFWYKVPTDIANYVPDVSAASPRHARGAASDRHWEPGTDGERAGAGPEVGGTGTEAV